MRPTRLLCAAALVLSSSTASPQGYPVGPEFRVNTYTTGGQAVQGVAADPSGKFVVVWWGQGVEETDGVFGQRYDSSGIPVGPEFHVNTFITSQQTKARVATDAAGNFVVVWQSFTQDGSDFGVFGQRYDSSGAAIGPEFRVNSYTTGFQGGPTIAVDPAGNFVVVWGGDQPGSFDVFGQRYASTGAPLGPEFRINSYTTDSQGPLDVAADTSGNFVVVWQSLSGDGSSGAVFGQRYASSGAPVGPEFRVNTYTTNAQAGPSVAVDAAGNFVVVWTSYPGQDGSSGGVFGQRYASSGSPIGPEFQVNTYTTGAQYATDVGIDPSGDFVVVWVGGSPYGGSDTFGQRYASSGAPLGPEFRVNSYTTGSQGYGKVAVDSTGRFVVVWGSFPNQDGSGFGVFGQRFSMIVPVELMHFRVE